MAAIGFAELSCKEATRSSSETKPSSTAERAESYLSRQEDVHVRRLKRIFQKGKGKKGKKKNQKEIFSMKDVRAGEVLPKVIEVDDRAESEAGRGHHPSTSRERPEDSE